MKTWMKMAAAALAATLLTVVVMRAGSFVFLGSLVAINNTTTNTPSVGVMSFTLPNITATVQHGALTSTNDLPIIGQVSIDNVNWINVSTNWPTKTNALAVDVWTAVWTTNPVVYLRASITTSNNVSATGTFSYPTP